MAVGTLDGDDGEVMSAIMPLVDVMRVLLIIFIIAIPVIKHVVKINFRRASSHPRTSSRSLICPAGQCIKRCQQQAARCSPFLR